jgi:hypothetical protein
MYAPAILNTNGFVVSISSGVNVTSFDIFNSWVTGSIEIHVISTSFSVPSAILIFNLYFHQYGFIPLPSSQTI